MILPIVKLPGQVLRRPVENLTFPLSKPVVRMFKDMLDTVKHADGVGLAAPQIGKNLNVAIIYLAQAKIPPFMIINPKVTKRSRETSTIEEGCLSLPGLFGEVKRPKKISIEAYDMEGKPFNITDETFLARVLQHEIDHLNNILIIDKFEKITDGSDLVKKYSDEVH